LNGIAKRLAPAGLFSADPCDCWLQLAEAYSLDDLVVVADGLMRYTEPIVFQFQLADAVGTAHRLPGLRRAREALKLARDGTDSPAETRLRLALVKDGLPCPEVNYPVRPDGVRTVYRLDMAYPANHVAVEYDGAIHVGNSAQMRRDQTRRRRLEDWGWRVITATATDLHDPAEVVASVRQALADSA
jgi:very-short-patch-repair endonuclease